MNKSELISAIAEKSGQTKVDSQKFLNAFMDVVAETMKKGDKISLIGFGTFSVAERKARNGINPKTKKPIKIKASKSVKFKAGAELKL